MRVKIFVLLFAVTLYGCDSDPEVEAKTESCWCEYPALTDREDGREARTVEDKETALRNAFPLVPPDEILGTAALLHERGVKVIILPPREVRDADNQ